MCSNTTSENSNTWFCYSWSRPFLLFSHAIHQKILLHTKKKSNQCPATSHWHREGQLSWLITEPLSNTSASALPFYSLLSARSSFKMSVKSYVLLMKLFQWLSIAAPTNAQNLQNGFQGLQSVFRSGGVRQWNCPFVNFSRVFLLWPWVAFSFI